ncbi:FtsW/RodA/SpoVE family cell cycle protein [Capnocytophaga sp. ARDL2]|uniref:FtsW/RodA/SpoVE family cell cycle protein n=1 Tax=Capnocytophaga sp. ARDL2 TaxID=3238809 RepID=UPI00355681C4
MNISRIFRGDIKLWVGIFVLMILSLFLSYSTASHHIYTINNPGSTESILFKHFVHLLFGLAIIWGVHRMKSKWMWYVAPVSWIVSLFLILVARMQNIVIGGADASRWVKVPVIGVSFQPSSLGILSLILYAAWYVSWSQNKPNLSKKVKYSVIGIPLFVVAGLVGNDNLSTALMMILICMIVLLVGGFPRKDFIKIAGVGLIFGILGFGLIKAFPDIAPSRFKTWVSRIDRFGSSSPDKDTYQVDNAKIAIAQGEWFGLGPGKSTFKNLLPQASSDFVYAIIVEEYGVVTGIILLLTYIGVFVRICIIATRTDKIFSKMMVFGIGFFTIVQTFINSGVAVELLPTTGQPLPLVSAGGSFIWITCISLGLVLSVSRENHELKAKKIKKEKKSTNKKVEETNYHNVPEDNPMSAVVN